MEKLTKRKEAELRLIAELTFGATIAAQAKLAKLGEWSSVILPRCLTDSNDLAHAVDANLL